MKGKTFIKLFSVIISVLAVVSCIQPIDPAIERTEALEMELLNEYIDSLHNRGLDVDTTALGVYYVIDNQGEGPYPAEGDTCVLKYQGFLLSNNVIFDASANYNPTDSTYSYLMGDNQVIPGWKDGMRVINEGARAYLIIPSNLAYGSTGNYYNIGPYETLIFKIDMVDIKQAY